MWVKSPKIQTLGISGMTQNETTQNPRGRRLRGGRLRGEWRATGEKMLCQALLSKCTD